jgi:hypothetical protein
MTTEMLSDRPVHLSAAEGLPLASLVGSKMASRFYSWLGLSGTRYVCTIFRAGEEETLACFEGAVIIGVAQKEGVRRPVCAFQPTEFAENRSPRLAAALAMGVNEWHVHFSSDIRQLAGDIGCAID